MKKAIFLFVMILLPLIANADAVEIDGIYYNLISKVNVAEVACGPFTYKKDDHGNSTPAKGYYKGSIVIPESVTYEGVNYSVASINGGKDFYYSSPGGSFSYHGGAFYMCDELTSIVIPSSVTLIGSDTFYGCSSLTSITIPSGVTNIEAGTFSGCSGLTSVTIPEGVTSIGNSAFQNCSGLTSINIPESVTSIGNDTFYGCSGLTSVTIPEGVTSIGNSAFSCCSGLTSITIPESVTTIGDCAFYGCI